MRRGQDETRGSGQSEGLSARCKGKLLWAEVVSGEESPVRQSPDDSKLLHSARICSALKNYVFMILKMNWLKHVKDVC